MLVPGNSREHPLSSFLRFVKRMLGYNKNRLASTGVLRAMSTTRTSPIIFVGERRKNVENKIKYNNIS